MSTKVYGFKDNFGRVEVVSQEDFDNADTVTPISLVTSTAGPVTQKLNDYAKMKSVRVVANGLELKEGVDFSVSAAGELVTVSMGAGVHLTIYPYYRHSNVATITHAEYQDIVSRTDPKAILNIVYPVGSIYMSINNVNPETFIGGTWAAITGRFLLSADANHAVESTGGEEKHTLSLDETPSHGNHLYQRDGEQQYQGSAVKKYLGTAGMSDWGDYPKGWNNWSGGEFYPAGRSVGGGQPHNNMPPYFTVYMWRRTA